MACTASLDSSQLGPLLALRLLPSTLLAPQLSLTPRMAGSRATSDQGASSTLNREQPLQSWGTLLSRLHPLAGVMAAASRGLGCWVRTPAS